MFARDRSAHFDAKLNNFIGALHCAAKLSFVARIERNDRVQIAIPGVKNVADLEAILFSDFFDALERGRKFRARDHAVLHVIGWRNAPHGAERVLAAFPK